MNEDQIRQLIREELSRFLTTDRFIFDRKLQIMDSRNIQLGKTTGTKLGTESTQKLGFYGTTPVVKQSLSPIAGGAIASDGTARAGVNSIITVLQTYGLG